MYRAACAALFLLWVVGVLLIALYRAETREQLLHRLATTAQDDQEPTP